MHERRKFFMSKTRVVSYGAIIGTILPMLWWFDVIVVDSRKEIVLFYLFSILLVILAVWYICNALKHPVLIISDEEILAFGTLMLRDSIKSVRLHVMDIVLTIDDGLKQQDYRLNLSWASPKDQEIIKEILLSDESFER